MAIFKAIPKKRRWPKIVAALVLMGIILGVGAIIAAQRWYEQNLLPVGSSQHVITVAIPRGSSLEEIAKILKQAGVIRNDRAFQQYVRNRNAENKLQAGTYELRPSQSVAEILNILTLGKIQSNLVTIIPGHRLDQVRATLINAGFSTADVDAALNPNNYVDHPAVADKPTEANLEGYLYPESFQKTAETTAKTIVRQSLDQMQKRLTPEIRTAFAKKGLSVHEGIILASMVEQEVSKPEDRTKVAQVFLKRLKMGMRLESDPTAKYGAIVAGQQPSLSYDSLYNTYKHEGLPIGPISNVTQSSLEAVVRPADTDWLYFVSGDDGVTYFSKTLEEHEKLVNAHCKNECAQ